MRRLAAALSLVLMATDAYAAEPAAETRAPAGNIAFSSLGPRGWDVYLADVPSPAEARRVTVDPALDYNAALSPDGELIAFVSERDGNMELYTVRPDGSALTRLTRDFALDDHPTWSPDGRRIAFASTRQPAPAPGQAWNAVYVLERDGSDPRRLTPADATDYSPAWSPGGEWIAVAAGSGKTGGTDLFVMKPDGGDRRLVEKNGGWPSFSADGQWLFFHSHRDGRWGIWKVKLDGGEPVRVTPREVEAHTPQASRDGRWLAVAVRRGAHRQIERLNLATGELTAVTKDAADHWNPSLSADGSRVAYHQAAPGFETPNVETWGTPPAADFKLLRLAGSFPAFSPDGRRLALLADGFARLDVMNVDGSQRKTLYNGQYRGMFSSSWSHGDDRIAFAVGGVFQDANAGVDLMSVRPDGEGLTKLTHDAGNNGFPSYSPDGKQFVCRSGREGSKNLFILNQDGSPVRQLTSGKWTDTMCDWSPDGQWIAFASDRDGDFDVWLIHPDGSDLHKLIGGGGRHNHPHFSPGSDWIVFTTQRAGFSAEEISLPNQPQPYGELFVIRRDGAGLLRLTHNGFEEGTPAWGAAH